MPNTVIRKNISKYLDNSYFEIRHSSPLGFFVNGLQCGASSQSTTMSKNFIIGSRRPENLGENLYAIHFIKKFQSSIFNILINNLKDRI